MPYEGSLQGMTHWGVLIPGESPCGDDLSLDPEFELLHDEIGKDKSLYGDQKTDWIVVFELSDSLLSRTKDLWPFSLLTLAMEREVPPATGDGDVRDVPDALGHIRIYRHAEKFAVKLMVAKGKPQARHFLPLHLKAHLDPLIGPWLEAAPPDDETWDGFMAGATNAEVVAFGVGPGRGIPREAMLEYPILSIKGMIGDVPFNACAAKNTLSADVSCFILLDGVPTPWCAWSIPKRKIWNRRPSAHRFRRNLHRLCDIQAVCSSARVAPESPEGHVCRYAFPPGGTCEGQCAWPRGETERTQGAPRAGRPAWGLSPNICLPPSLVRSRLFPPCGVARRSLNSPYVQYVFVQWLPCTLQAEKKRLFADGVYLETAPRQGKNDSDCHTTQELLT